MAQNDLFIAISFYPNIFLSQYLFIPIFFYRNIFLSQYLFITIYFYQNIVRQNIGSVYKPLYKQLFCTSVDYAGILGFIAFLSVKAIRKHVDGIDPGFFFV